MLYNNDVKKLKVISPILLIILIFSGAIYFWFTQPMTVYEYFGKFGETLGAADFPSEVEPTPVSPEFTLIISKLKINAPVLANVDGTNPSEYLWKVKQGIAHFRKTKTKDYDVDGAFPGEGGNIFLFGHSQIPGGDMSNYQGIFNNLEKLIPGDQVVVFYQGERFEYEVETGRVVGKHELQYLGPTSEETLSLMTCWPLGLDVRRYIVLAKRNPEAIQ